MLLQAKARRVSSDSDKALSDSTSENILGRQAMASQNLSKGAENTTPSPTSASNNSSTRFVQVDYRKVFVGCLNFATPAWKVHEYFQRVSMNV
mmetsp:Transcript_34087/g.87926  ORF Transcript_34087/g.87926 Transcript_34087/m.87926 type:complete len:93 (+) Transcript_34087:30-308(+)